MTDGVLLLDLLLFVRASMRRGDEGFFLTTLCIVGMYFTVALWRVVLAVGKWSLGCERSAHGLP